MCADVFKSSAKKGAPESSIARALKTGAIIGFQKMASDESFSHDVFVVQIKSSKGETYEAIVKDASPEISETVYKIDRDLGLFVVPVTVGRKITLPGHDKPSLVTVSLKMNLDNYPTLDSFNEALKNNPNLQHSYWLTRMFQYLIYDIDVNYHNIGSSSSDKRAVYLDADHSLKGAGAFGSDAPFSILDFEIDFAPYENFYHKVVSVFTPDYIAQKVREANPDSQGALSNFYSYLMNNRASFIYEFQRRLPQLRPANFDKLEAPLFFRTYEIPPVKKAAP